MIKNLITQDQVAEILGVSASIVNSMAREGSLKGIKIGREWRFKEEDVQAFINGMTGDGHKDEPVPAPAQTFKPAATKTLLAGAVIVTRHPGATEWLAKRGIYGKHYTYVLADDVADEVVVGNIPFHLAWRAKVVGWIEFPQLPPELRDRELTCKQMEGAGARIVWYSVTRLTEQEALEKGME